jgi:hypothetical protein
LAVELNVRRGQRHNLAAIAVILVANRDKHTRPSLSQLERTYGVSRKSLRKYFAALIDNERDGWLSSATRDDNNLTMLDFLLARVPKRGGAHAGQAKRSPLADQVLRDAVADKPEMYLDELAAVLLARTGVRVSVSTVHRWCAQLGLTRKRVAPVALARVSERVQRLRADYKQVTQPSLPSVVGNVLFTDESHFDERSVQRRYGRAPSGQKAVVAQPYNGGRARRERLTLLLAVGVHRNAVTQRLEPVVAARVSSGSTNAVVYADFVTRE